ncbi:Galectin domain-containing protein [Caenorhabditis elegans]|nr:Galectin domain-containing protein [Caenorhabditis elegans]CTQ86766.1 Galectin domain-containing protein [Caenorhabditis elegans]|eukprot:NP_001300067.1 Galectin [Caenorhabditis elegans]
MCDFPHRVPVESIRTISINGNIRVDYVEFHPPEDSMPTE